ncbi:flagellar biosynthesis protein FlhB [Caminibacter mediatlanticus TB-2]|uniref:Flagellar basal body protein FlhB n=1 Tax=Caminibacter mediatlanticus TB-2 TaxID=391592 RepID=A0AAI9F215_9BACT|nr:EscU/YscU/HrcU family type III secretion system export apparatus switch protein [Caminibacter mediatlanticus]EDM23329.1 flagellar basal body protein FlhB [Caminibacter mediatlanticus TB-2]QCT93751.1 flagellar biosynthesis protein FlhB [Caminibacter mediatlanticus TB-2]
MKKYTNIKAAALRYKAYEDLAPKVIAKGKGEIAEKIIQKAKEFDIPLFQNEELVDSLLKIDNDTIPPELYKAVVEVFIWLYKMEEKIKLSDG